MSEKQYGFHVDTTRCTGCKTCEMACRDAYRLGDTSSFRRVCEYTGGSWQQEGPAWRHDVFSYYVSIACNHCTDPICQQICPSGAMRKGDDGFVVCDSNRCFGCRGCALACPYKAPSYSESIRAMRKCDGCRARVAQGALPICVEACPMRALSFGPIEDLRAKYGVIDTIAPMPPSHFTKPNVVVTPHPKAKPFHAPDGRLANEKEI